MAEHEAKVAEVVQDFFNMPMYTPISVNEKSVYESVVKRIEYEHHCPMWHNDNVLMFDEWRTKKPVIVRTGGRAEKVREELFHHYLVSHEDSDFELSPGIVTVLQPNRITGRTTRIADEIVKEIIESEPGTEFAIRDHYGTRQADRFLADIIGRRLEAEYGIKTKVFYGGMQCKMVKIGKKEEDE